MSKFEIYYCPGCGYSLKSYETHCPMCHSELKKKDITSEIKDFVDELAKIRTKQMPKKEESILKKVVGFDFKDEEEEKNKFEEEKQKEVIEFIKNYPINSSTNFILSFMLLISNNIGSKDITNNLEKKTWLDKFKQVYEVANMSINDKKDLELIQNIYNNKMKELKDKKSKTIIIVVGSIVTLFSMVYPVLALLFVGGVVGYLKLKKGYFLPKNLLFKIFLIVIAVFSIISLIVSLVDIDEDSSKKIVFSDLVLGDKIPKIEGKGDIYSNSNENLDFYVNKIKPKEYYSYLKKCEDMGYVIDVEKTDDEYLAFSEDGYKLNLSYSEYSKRLDIELTKNVEYDKFEWPETEFVQLIPSPKSNYGKIIVNENENFSIEVSKITIDNFKDYISQCKEKGFTEDIKQEDKKFFAKNKDGYRLNVEYLGNNVIKISLSERLYKVNLKIDCTENIILNKYGIEVYIDGDYLGDIDHGSNDTYEIELSKGKHEVKIESSDDYEYDTDGKININVTGDSTLELEVTCNTDNIKIKNKTEEKEQKKANEKKKTTEEKESKDEIKEDIPESVYYSTNDSKTVKNGNKGIYTYIKKGKEYDVYLILDLDEKFVYMCCYGNGDDSCWKSEITSGDLNNGLVVTLHDGSNTYQEFYHFKYVNSPYKLILVDSNQFTFEYEPTSLEDALKIKNSRRMVDL